MMDRQDTETDTEECCPTQRYHEERRKQVESYHDLKRCLKCNQPRSEIPPDLVRRRVRRAKDQVQHCPSCHCPPETVKYSMGRTNCSKNMDAVLNEYENLLTNPTSQTFKKSQSNTLSPRLYGVSACNGSAYAHYHSRKRQPNTHRRQCRIEQDQVHSIMKNILHSGENDNICYEYPRSMKNSYKKESYYMRDEHHQLGDHEDADLLYTRGRLRFNLAGKHGNRKKMDLEEGAEENRNVQGKKKSDPLPNKLSILKGCASQTSKTNGEELPKHKSLAIDTNDYAKEEELPKEDENARPVCKPCQRSTTRQDSPCSPGKESTSNTEETREDSSYCELAVKDEEQDIPNRKNTYAGGDLNPDFNLRATKSYIIGLIDRVLSKKFATSPGQQKNTESNRELTEQGYSVEIVRALRGDCYELFTKDVSSHHETPAECIKRLKNLRWQHMQHIQNEFKKLCDLQKFLDEYSPRESLLTFQPNTVEQRPEERQPQQQQHEEKQNLGT
ncbi:uncharacterized protein LOC102680442 isoform X1 [Apis dorsata]|uniref:uncharacterized protein LOC102680442 isoform X1 n=3 Tax=Apis dorsata TaxID=7462 RepID=UPI0003DF7B1C|nr:uncharacterized protein LOC102680442 isoform X1 [Apis dorsata]XP_031367619.1 uncharacterized protein LOC102680442 isoform X1 [Apis dorsata]